jgi:hypothetical protein
MSFRARVFVQLIRGARRQRRRLRLALADRRRRRDTSIRAFEWDTAGRLLRAEGPTPEAVTLRRSFPALGSAAVDGKPDWLCPA